MKGMGRRPGVGDRPDIEGSLSPVAIPAVVGRREREADRILLSWGQDHPPGVGAPVLPPRVPVRRLSGRDARARESSPRRLEPARPRLDPAGLHVASGRAVEVACGLHVEFRSRHALPRTEPSQPVVRPIKIHPGTVVGIAKAEIIGRRGQVGVGPVVRAPRCASGRRRVPDRGQPLRTRGPATYRRH